MGVDTRGEFVLRVSPWAYLVDTIAVAALGGLLAYASAGPGSRASTVVVVVLSVYGCSLAWLRSFLIRIERDQLVFRSLFRGTKAVAVEDIKSVELKFEFGGGGGPLKLVVESRELPGEPALMINAKVFSQEAIETVLDFGNRVARADSHSLKDGVVWKLLGEHRAKRKR